MTVSVKLHVVIYQIKNNCLMHPVMQLMCKRVLWLLALGMPD